MNRRALLGAIGTVAVAGCLGSANESMGEPVDSLSDKLPDDRIYDFNEPAEYDVVLIQARSFNWDSSVRYTDHESADIKKWDPGEGMNVVVAGLYVENLSNEQLSYPSWDEFKLVTVEGEHDPVLETPDGTSVDNIRDPHVSWPGSSGLRASYKRGWNNVFAAPAYDIENYAIKWDHPEDPIYWRPQQ